MLRQGNSKLVTGVRTLSTSLWVCNNHYDVLGVTPKSTQSDIKTAYYKLSKVYHPDKSPDETAAKKFRDITEAYEVLGNVKLKKMYDKGLLGNSSKSPIRPKYQPEPEPTDPTVKFYASRANRHVVPTMDGKTPIYNFDAWAKNHYTNLYETARYDREFVKQRRAKQEEAALVHRQETLMMIAFVLGSIFIMLVVQGTGNYDQDLTAKNNVDIETQSIKE